VTWPPVFARKVACAGGYGVCAALKHGLIIVSEFKGDGGSLMHMHSLADGSLVRSIGSKGSGKGQFNFGCGGLCVSPDGDSLLVAEAHNNRVQEVKIVDGSWVRFFGRDALDKPQFVDCNADVIAVSQDRHRISVLSWAAGGVLAHFGSYGTGPGQLRLPRGVRLLGDGSGLVVADYSNDRLCVFSLSGALVKYVGSKELELNRPTDVLECVSDGSFIVANPGGNHLSKMSRDGVVLGVYGKQGLGNGEFDRPSALAALPDGGLIVREDKQLQVFVSV
jgi:hypothetical protein